MDNYSTKVYLNDIATESSEECYLRVIFIEQPKYSCIHNAKSLINA